MFSNLKVYKCGNFYNIISINLKTSSHFQAKQLKISNDKKLKNNLIRCKTNIQNLVLCNDFKYFITITFNQKYDRFNLDILRLSFRSIIKQINRKYNINLKYLIVPEQHKNGAWHFHGFLTECKEIIKLNEFGYKTIPEIEMLGFMNIDNIISIEKCSNYITKYIQKNIGSGIKKEKHSFFCSTKLARPILVNDLIYNNEWLNNHFFDYKNDYCFKKICSSEEYYKFITVLK